MFNFLFNSFKPFKPKRVSITKSYSLKLKTHINDDYILELMRAPSARKMEQGLKLMMDQYQERLYWMIRKMVEDHDDANDVLQNCFIKAYRSVNGFKGNSKLYTWLYRIASNEAITFLNKRKKRSTSNLEGIEGTSNNSLKADAFFDENQAQIWLQNAIQTLPDKQKEVFLMRYYDELSYREMTEILGTSTGALKASYHHAVKKIERFFRGVESH